MIRIASGQRILGEMLPGRASLATEYAVDLTTVQRAVFPLLKDGTLCADARRGTFVARAQSQTPAPHTDVALRTVGIVAASPYGSGATQGNDDWTRTVLSAVERVFAQRQIEVHFVNRLRESGDPTPAPDDRHHLQRIVGGRLWQSAGVLEGCRGTFRASRLTNAGELHRRTRRLPAPKLVVWLPGRRQIKVTNARFMG
ncbi:MAG: GntR family transcriptional regulator [Armatimonadetes bacterium]|nr:GntR family transcriptional regulator [Armatimonadota bacterium]